MSSSDTSRLSVALIDVLPGQEEAFKSVAAAFSALLLEKGYGRSDMIRDEAVRHRYYAVRHWTDASAAERCHADPDVQALTAQLYQTARVTHVVNGARRPDPRPASPNERRARTESDRRAGFDRRGKDAGHGAGVNRRSGQDRRIGARRLRDRAAAVDLVEAARRAREHAVATFSTFKVGAALEASGGAVITGCNVENATYGLTICAERVAMFKALSEGHRAFTRIAIVADTEAPTPPCGACRQILWEFGGNLEIHLANLADHKGTHQLSDLLPLPFDARLL